MMTVISRHRLPAPYRAALTILWAMPAAILLLALIAGHGLSRSLLDLRLWLLLGLMLLPGCYIWQEGVDVLVGGLRARIGLHQIYAYSALSHWQLDPVWQLLKVWDQRCEIVIVRYLAHFSHPEALLEALRQHIPDKERQDSINSML
jgi:hypothetical protein